MELESAPDINETAWNPERDSGPERRSLLRELDPLPSDSVWATFIPERRTWRGLPLGERRRALLLGCTTEDLEVIANEVNLEAEIDDDDEAAALTGALEAYEELLGRHRLLPRDSDERTVARMPVTDRRLARQLQNDIVSLQAVRYDGTERRRRANESSVKRLKANLAAAREQGNSVQVAEYERLIALHQPAQ